ncbi:mitochondrial carrier domain-containing protein [Blakeslea trispora]|nr:mitochondrial carrier domain-containing protein [Blakeslea trispora]
MPSHITSSKLSANETALCGGFAGLTTRFAISPLDVVKIRLQVQPEPYTIKRLLSSQVSQANIKYSGIIQAFKTIVAEEGVKGLFKGNVAAEWLYVTYGASQFYAYYYLDQFMKKQDTLPPTFKPFLSGMLAGSFATATTYPFDLLRTRFAIQGETKVYNSITHAVLDIHEKEGIRGFYRGLGSSITQIMPYMGLMFFSYEGLCSIVQSLKDKQVIPEDYKRTSDMACGSLAGIISKTGVFPLDVVRKRLQVQGPHLSEYVVSSIPSYSRENSVIGCIRKMIATEGVFSLYKGLVPGLLKAGPSGAVYFLMFELAKDGITLLKESGVKIIPDTLIYN